MAVTPPQTNPPLPPPPPGAGDGTNTEPNPLEVLEAEFRRIGAAEHGKGETAGKRAGKAELLAQLGFGSTADATSWVEAARAGQAGNETEMQTKLNEALGSAATAAANAFLLESSLGIMGKLLTTGVQNTRAEMATRQVMLDLAVLPDKPSEGDITAAVEAFKARVPEWFTPAGTAPGNGAGPGTPPPGSPSMVPVIGGTGGVGGPPPAITGTGTPEEAGMAEYERMKAQLQKSAGITPTLS